MVVGHFLAGILAARAGGRGGSAVLRELLQRASPATRFVVAVIIVHKALAIFAVIALEEIGIPLPLPGDLFILYAGHLVARHRLDAVSAFFAVVLGAVVGSSILFGLARTFGQSFVQRYGPYMHINRKRLDRAEEWFRKWGALVIIIGRHVPGFRMLISVFAGLSGVSWFVFVPSVAISASLWALIFLSLGDRIDRQVGPYLTITPAHLLPSLLFITGSIVYAVVLHRREKGARGRTAAAEAASPASPERQPAR